MDPHEDDLPLPPLDDAEEAPTSDGELPTTFEETEGDPMDDRELGGSVEELVMELATTHNEESVLEDKESASEVAPEEDDSQTHGVSLIGDDEAEGFEGEDPDLEESEIVGDTGDEGFEGEEDVAFGDLPRLDADEEGELEDALDLPAPPPGESVLWDDRAWDKVTGPIAIGAVEQMWLEGGSIAALTKDELVLVSPTGSIVQKKARPTSIPEPSSRKRQTIARANVEVSYASGAVGAVRESAEERTWLVRSFLAGGESGLRIVADVTDDASDESAEVSAIVVEPTRGCVWVGGNFGLLAYRPPKS